MRGASPETRVRALQRRLRIVIGKPPRGRRVTVALGTTRVPPLLEFGQVGHARSGLTTRGLLHHHFHLAGDALVLSLVYGFHLQLIFPWGQVFQRQVEADGSFRRSSGVGSLVQIHCG